MRLLRRLIMLCASSPHTTRLAPIPNLMRLIQHLVSRHRNYVRRFKFTERHSSAQCYNSLLPSTPMICLPLTKASRFLLINFHVSHLLTSSAFWLIKRYLPQEVEILERFERTSREQKQGS